MGSDHYELLLQAEIHWLSWGRILTQILKLPNEARIHLLQSNFLFSHYFEVFSWPAKLAYLTDVSNYLNGLKKFSVKSQNMFSTKKSMMKKSGVWTHSWNQTTKHDHVFHTS
jgi:hypothetical protein